MKIIKRVLSAVASLAVCAAMTTEMFATEPKYSSGDSYTDGGTLGIATINTYGFYDVYSPSGSGINVGQWGVKGVITEYKTKGNAIVDDPNEIMPTNWDIKGSVITKNSKPISIAKTGSGISITSYYGANLNTAEDIGGFNVSIQTSSSYYGVSKRSFSGNYT